MAQFVACARSWQPIPNRFAGSANCYGWKGWRYGGLMLMEYWAKERSVPQNIHACWAALDRSRLSSRSCAAEKAQPHVPHLQVVNELDGRLGPLLLAWGWFVRIARTNSPPHFEHSRFCIYRPWRHAQTKSRSAKSGRLCIFAGGCDRALRPEFLGVNLYRY